MKEKELIGIIDRWFKEFVLKWFEECGEEIIKKLRKRMEFEE